MSNALNRKTLVLNKAWTAIRIVSVKDAICEVFKDKARILDPKTFVLCTFDDWFQRGAEDGSGIQTIHGVFAPPTIIVLLTYDRIPPMLVQMSRRNLYVRDNFTCQYCGATPGTRELSIDHVVPKSQGGITSWENCVLACTSCNSKKGHRSLKSSNMHLLHEPKRPEWSFKFASRSSEYNSDWATFISDEYWTVTLTD